MRSRVELFEQIRRDRRVEDLSIRELADRHRVHRRTVRQALAVGGAAAAEDVSGAAAAGDRPVDVGDRRLAARRSGGAAQAAAHGPAGLAAAGRRARRDAVGGDGVAVCRPPPGRARPGRRARWRSRRPTCRARRPRSTSASSTPTIAGALDQVLDVRDAAVALGQGVPRRVRHPGAGGVPGRPRARVRALRRRPGPDPLRQPQARRGPGAQGPGPGRVRAVHRAARRITGSTRSSACPAWTGAHEKGGVEGEIGRFRRRHLVPGPERRVAGER